MFTQRTSRREPSGSQGHRALRTFEELDLDDLEKVAGGLNNITVLHPNNTGRVSVLPAPGFGSFDMDGQQVFPGNSPFAPQLSTQRFDDGSTARVDQHGNIFSTTDGLAPNEASFHSTMLGLNSTEQAQSFAERSGQDILNNNPNIDLVHTSIDHTGLSRDGTPMTNTLNGSVGNDFGDFGRFGEGQGFDQGFSGLGGASTDSGGFGGLGAGQGLDQGFSSLGDGGGGGGGGSGGDGGGGGGGGGESLNDAAQFAGGSD